ncbi:flagellar basal body L-ring protein FlgH [Bacillus thermophilus]|uniref:Flagellar basal body L-ring protein FlgH n=1 Tax=Siminovitchia thermophila TaxID=1245522 RepID=A0ABS2R6T1_9BACI|nr:YolD-like family protein [Siminovitchia thermophila]MBM7715356.1 flagellar basal body L-ring protein FlgH [Siminovitchia thermophila]
MRISKLTPGLNLRWESSRMMLPEHKEQIISHNNSKKLISKPILDEQKWIEINDLLTIAIEDYVPVHLSVYNAGSITEKNCHINKFDIINKKLHITTNDDIEQIPIENITDVKLS